MILNEGALPPKYREEVMRLMSMIEVATDDAGVRRAGSYAEEVVRGIETARALRDSHIHATTGNDRRIIKGCVK